MISAKWFLAFSLLSFISLTSGSLAQSANLPSGKKLSEITVIKFDTKILDKLNASCDIVAGELEGQTMYIDRSNYTVNAIYRDSEGNVISHSIFKWGNVIYGEEYYPNGQLRIKLPYSNEGVLSGFCRYYYEDGRISNEGYWKDDRHVGRWKEYDTNGKLIEVIDYGNRTSKPKVYKY